MSEPGYPNKKPTSLPPIITDGYNSQAAPVRPPAASKFGVGATNLTEIKDACDQRRAHSDALRNLPRPPRQSPQS
jgi:hypothetical protein